MGTIFGEMFDKLLPLPTNKLKTFSLNAIRRIVKEINQTKSLYFGSRCYTRKYTV